MKGFFAGILFTLVTEGVLAVTVIAKKVKERGDE